LIEQTIFLSCDTCDLTAPLSVPESHAFGRGSIRTYAKSCGWSHDTTIGDMCPACVRDHERAKHHNDHIHSDRYEDGVAKHCVHCDREIQWDQNVREWKVCE
jgi:hypothetical protein